jgi:acetyl-CoA C-acetyltransferase
MGIVSGMREAVIVGGARTAFGRLLGSLSDFTAVELGGIVIKAALGRAGLAGDRVDYVIMGQVLQAGAGQIPSRQAALAGGIPMTVPSITVNKVCLSGLAAIALAAQLIRAGEFEIVVAGGMESMSGAPHLLPGARRGYRFGSAELIDAMAHDGLTDAFDQVSMGESTERNNASLGISRADQDEFAALSHQRAVAAIKNGLLTEEIIAVPVPQRRGDPVIFDTDEGVRADVTADSLSRLRPAFAVDGTITAGTASQISDGACAVVVASAEAAAASGLPVLATIGAHGNIAGPDNSLHSQPSGAIRHALGKAGRPVRDLDLIEINEAFAAVAIQSMRDLDVGIDRVNVNGGAIAIGHPIGASGARIALHLVNELRRRGGGLGVAALCGGGGQGDALLLEVPAQGRG